jgi:hypothetical protein
MLRQLSPFLILLFFVFVSLQNTDAQVNTPKLSPSSTVTQELGMGEIEINYSRPSKRERVIFGNIVSYNEVWRLGANKNTTFQSSEDLYFGSDTLFTGKYALYAIPKKQSWELIFYSESSNWGTPDEWDDSKVALRLSVGLTTLEKDVETLTISIDDLTTSGASLNISWGRVHLSTPFSMDTRTKVIESINNALAGPSGNDFYRAAKYYFAEKIDKELALEWIGKAVEMRGVEAFWMTRLQAQIMAWNGQYKLAIEVAQISIKAAFDQGNETYVRMNEASISEWKKMK